MGSKRTERASWERWAAAGAVLVVAVPIVTAIVALDGKSWIPAGDEAPMLLRTKGVGTLQSPLIGVYSTRPWAHPGPILFYLLAAPFRLLGGEPIDLFRAAGLLNLISLALIGYLSWRRRGLRGTLLAMTATAMVLLGMGPDIMVGAWNPYIPLLLYLAFLLSGWALLEQDWKLLPLAAFLGSAIIQMHVAYGPLVAIVAALIAVAHWQRARRDDPDRLAPTSRAVLLSIGLVALMWLPPVLDQLFVGGNLRNLAGYFTDSRGVPPIGLADGLGLLSSHTSLAGPLTGHTLPTSFASIVPGALAPLVLMVVLLVGSIVLARRLDRPSALLPGLALVELIGAGLAAGRIEQPVLGYLVIWMTPLAAFCWFAVALTAIEAVLARLDSAADGRPLPIPQAVAMGVVATLGLGLVATSMDTAGSPTLPRQEHVAAVQSISDQLLPQLDPDRPIRVVGVGDDFNVAWVGVVYQLEVHGYDFSTLDGAKGLKWGKDHVYKRGQKVDAVLTFATQLESSFTDAVNECEQDPSQEQVAYWDQLDPSQRGRMRTLQQANFVAKGKLPTREAKELQRLSAHSFRLAVFKGSQPCVRN